MKKADELLSSHGLKVKEKEIVTSSSVPDAIIDYAEKKSIDLIIIGSLGLSASSKFKLGSVSSTVVRYAHCSVYVVKA
ncbi:MAG TPA: universal stress protein [Nitrospirae bacterium]|nr:universal stress protein [Nitrospirota bacterium]